MMMMMMMMMMVMVMMVIVGQEHPSQVLSKKQPSLPQGSRTMTPNEFGALTVSPCELFSRRV